MPNPNTSTKPKKKTYKLLPPCINKTTQKKLCIKSPNINKIKTKGQHNFKVVANTTNHKEGQKSS